MGPPLSSLLIKMKSEEKGQGLARNPLTYGGGADWPPFFSKANKSKNSKVLKVPKNKQQYASPRKSSF
jgi:hypothetical protein